MNRTTLYREAQRFSGEGKAMIHSEWMFGTGAETMLAGDLTGQLYMVSCILDRISEITHQDFNDSLEVVKLLHIPNNSKQVVTGEKTDTKGPADLYQEQAAAAAEKKYSHQLKAAQDEAERLRTESVADKATIRRLKETIEVNRQTALQEKLEIQRKLNAANAENKKLQAKVKQLKIDLKEAEDYSCYGC